MDQRIRAHVTAAAESGHPERALRYLELSRPVLDELWSGDQRDRMLAIFLAGAGKRADFLAAALADAGAREQIRILSASNAVLLPIPALRAVVDEAPVAVRHRLYRSLRRHRHHPAADALLPSVRERWGDREAARLLPSCAPEIVAEQLPALAWAVGSWRPLATRHPGRYLDELERQLAETPALLREKLWNQHEAGLHAVSAANPERALELLERFGPPYRLPAFFPRSRALARAAPARYLRLWLAHERIPWARRHRPGRAVLRILARAHPPELDQLAERELVAVLAALPPSRREALHDSVHNGFDAGGGGSSWVAFTPLTGARFGAGALPAQDRALELLPDRRRHAQARQRLELHRRHGNEATTLEVAAHLPLDEARSVLDPRSRSGDAAERGSAYGLLIECASRTRAPEPIREVLGEIGERVRNEQDPVRAGVLAACSAVPPALFPPEVLARLTEDAMRARDRSAETANALGALARRILSNPGAPAREQALRTLGSLFTEADWLPGHLENRWVQPLWELVRSSVDGQCAGGRFAPLLQFANRFARATREIGEVQDRLRDCVEHGTEQQAAEAIAAWLADPRHRSERVAEVLRIDPTAIAIDRVQQAVFDRRPDLFHDAVHARSPGPGRFLPRGGPCIPVRSGAARLLPRDQPYYADLLEHVITEDGRPLHQRTAAMSALAEVPAVGPKMVASFAESGELVLAEAALAALSRTDAPEEALTTLLAHGSGEQARVAISSALRCARFVAPTRLAAALSEALETATKVTSRKRLVAATTLLESTMDFVLPVWRDDREHRDVRAACAATAVRVLDDPRAWSVLRESAGTEPEIQRPLLRVAPLDLAPRHRRAYAELLIDIAEQADVQLRQRIAQVIGPWHAFHEGAGRWLSKSITGLEDRRHSTAIPALIELVAGGAGEQVLLDTVRELIDAASREGDLDALAERDRPARQRLLSLLQQVGSAIRVPRATWRPTALALSEILLEAGGEFRKPALSLLGYYTVRTGESDAALEDLRELAELHRDYPVSAMNNAQSLRQLMRHKSTDPDELLPAVRELAEAPGLAEGLFATALCAGGGERRNWPQRWREILRDLRAHPEPEVRQLALTEFTVRE